MFTYGEIRYLIFNEMLLDYYYSARLGSNWRVLPMELLTTVLHWNAINIHWLRNKHQ